jgi:signal transduction histidine kinase
MKNWPLRTRIAIWSALASALALLTFIAVVAFNLYAEQVEMIDVRLAADAALIGTDAAGQPDTKPLAALLASSAGHRRIAEQAALHGYALLRTTDGSLVQAQPAALAAAFGHWPKERWPLRKPFVDATLAGTRLRAGAFPHGATTLLLLAPLEPAEESVLDLLGAALIGLPVVLLVIAGGSWWIARRALEPIANITRAAASITADRLGERLPAALTRDEIGRHTEVLNGMFDRLQRSFEQATRFTADAAHELRTPLTIMRGQVEDALRSAPPEHEPLLVGLLEEITGLQKISDNLLLLARFDSGKNPLQRAPLDWSALLADAAEDAELLATPSGLKISAQLDSAIRVDGDAVMLRRVALNLIDNAVKFNRAAGEVKLTLRVDGAEALFTVGNTGPGIPLARRATLFQRFYRSDVDRNGDSGGSGLGLSLCREIVQAHDGEIELNCTDPDWTEFTVRLPRLSQPA